MAPPPASHRHVAPVLETGSLRHATYKQQFSCPTDSTRLIRGGAPAQGVQARGPFHVLRHITTRTQREGEAGREGGGGQGDEAGPEQEGDGDDTLERAPAPYVATQEQIAGKRGPVVDCP